MSQPHAELESELLGAVREPDAQVNSTVEPLVIGLDEVGRGALAGPVVVGACAVSRTTLAVPAPQGLNDSKLVSELTREWLEPEIHAWSVAAAVGVAEAHEIDAWGIIAALRLAGERALGRLAQSGHAASAIILDGKHNWLHAPRDLFAPEPAYDTDQIPVTMRIKADQTCVSVAAASIVAKVWRDREMQRLAALPEFAEYGFAGHKGYGAATHLEALRRLGPTTQHRRSWNLPTPTA
ncbi:ribonuclease HII [Micrococcales bacterium 31B]|nr:ribonuclease HII [Micrococcales bacterium 31B]